MTPRSLVACVLACAALAGACRDGTDGGLGAARQDDSEATTTTESSTTGSPTTMSTTTSTTSTTATSTTAAATTTRAPAATAPPITAPPATAATEPPAPPAPPVTSPKPTGATPTLASCPLFPANNYWHADVSGLAVHPNSANFVASIGATGKLKADFGSGLWDGGPIGIPYLVVPQGQAEVPVSFEYADESDPGPYPIPADAPIEGGAASDGDRHILVVEAGTCRLYETWSTYPGGAGWKAGSGAVFDLRSNALRPAGWTSSDAAGLPVLPGLVRYDEVAAGSIDHAIRITVPRTQKSYLWPARHYASSRTDPNLPPMGLWLRLRADFDISGFPRDAQVILQALKVHGAIVADNGSPWYLSGAPDDRWDNDVLATLRGVPGSAFDAVDTSGLVASPNSGALR
jgi:hypothetical protein